MIVGQNPCQGIGKPPTIRVIHRAPSYPQDGTGWLRRVERGRRVDNVNDERTLSWQFQLQGQSGVVSRQQARDAGFTEGSY